MVRIIEREYRYVREFMTYHEMIGVEHFVVYTPVNDTRSELRRIAKPWFDRGMITMKDYEDDDIPARSFLSTYNVINVSTVVYISNVARTTLGWFSQDIRNQSHWIGFIDMDEFLYMENDWLGTMTSRLRAFERASAIILDRETFDASGHRETPTGLVLEHYTSVYAPSRPDWVTFSGKVLCHSSFCSTERMCFTFCLRLNPMVAV